MKSIQPSFVVKQNGTNINVYHANKGEGLPRHEHVFTHLTFCHSGACVLRKEGRELVMTKKTQPVNLIENEWHEVEALEDDTVFVNVFAEIKP